MILSRYPRAKPIIIAVGVLLVALLPKFLAHLGSGATKLAGVALDFLGDLGFGGRFAAFFALQLIAFSRWRKRAKVGDLADSIHFAIVVAAALALAVQGETAYRALEAGFVKSFLGPLFSASILAYVRHGLFERVDTNNEGRVTSRPSESIS